MNWIKTLIETAFKALTSSTSALSSSREEEKIHPPTISEEIATKFAKKLNLLEPVFRKKIIMLLSMAREEGLEVGLFHGYRSYQQQRNIYAQGRSKPGKIVTNAKAGYSWHNFGVAADIVFYSGTKWSWAEKHKWQRLGKIGKSIGLEWGGDWRRPDRPHFQLKGSIKNTAQARKLYKEGGIESVWEAARL